jgi:hypothetical protein
MEVLLLVELAVVEIRWLQALQIVVAVAVLEQEIQPQTTMALLAAQA